jgi:hypothetical protein
MVKTIAATVILLTLSTASRADTLLIDGIEREAQTAAMRPRAGQSMSAVETNFGTPTGKHAPVGEPPITRWDYPGFSVYFERDLVIHAVAHP